MDGLYNLFFTKYDADGTRAWTQQRANGDSLNANGVAADSRCWAYAAGFSAAEPEDGQQNDEVYVSRVCAPD